MSRRWLHVWWSMKFSFTLSTFDGKIFADGFVHQTHLLGVVLANLSQMVIVAAVLQKLGNRQLQQYRRGDRVGKFQQLDALLESSRCAPADTETGRERLGNRSAQQ